MYSVQIFLGGVRNETITPPPSPPRWGGVACSPRQELLRICTESKVSRAAHQTLHGQIPYTSVAALRSPAFTGPSFLGRVRHAIGHERSRHPGRRMQPRCTGCRSVAACCRPKACLPSPSPPLSMRRGTLALVGAAATEALAANCTGWYGRPALGPVFRLLGHYQFLI